VEKEYAGATKNRKEELCESVIFGPRGTRPSVPNRDRRRICAYFCGNMTT
jgi:hypothetical protein